MWNKTSTSTMILVDGSLFVFLLELQWSIWLRQDTAFLGEQGLDDRFRNIMESFARFKLFLVITPNLPERSLAHTYLYHLIEENCNAFSFIDMSLRDGRGQNVSAHKRAEGDAHFDKGQVKNSTEGGSGPSGEDFKEDVNVGGGRDDDEEEE